MEESGRRWNEGGEGGMKQRQGWGGWKRVQWGKAGQTGSGKEGLVASEF